MITFDREWSRALTTSAQEFRVWNGHKLSKDVKLRQIKSWTIFAQDPSLQYKADMDASCSGPITQILVFEENNSVLFYPPHTHILQKVEQNRNKIYNKCPDGKLRKSLMRVIALS